ncbi:MAG: hypothetical protein KGO96_13210 [Elusimicrobia bacterium]|nr:hypothetical protein [Elusimicrobiota bacterium]MDE2238164.1 hypothetical protein [Elusimicrobiota bacterium]MDE2426853.1 hypothetical protein [Elusimicrobiota bacterium]
MSKYLIAALLSLPLSLHAAGLSDSLRTWFTHVKQGLTESSVSDRMQHRRLTAVAAVRGQKQQGVEAERPAWKSPHRMRRALALRRQKAELKAAVEAILAGKLDEGQRRLDAFDKKNPRGELLAESHEIRAHLELARAQPAAAPPAPQK